MTQTIKQFIKNNDIKMTVKKMIHKVIVNILYILHLPRVVASMLPITLRKRSRLLPPKYQILEIISLPLVLFPVEVLAQLFMLIGYEIVIINKMKLIKLIVSSIDLETH
jgi:hypothetical protein